MKPTDLSVSRDEILARHQKSFSDLQNDLIILKEWMEKQPHLPIDKLGDGFLEVQLLKNKFSVEKTKSKIENYCKIKANKNYSYFYEDFPTIPSEEAVCYVPMPKLTENYERIVIGKVFDDEKWDLSRECTNGLILREFLARFDYNEGEIFIMDYSNCSAAKILSMMRANVIADVMTIVLKGHSAKVKQIHIICKVFPVALNFLKPLMPSKVFSRIFAYKDVEEFKEKFHSCYLPKDYGGEMKSLTELRADLDKMYFEQRYELDEYVKTKSREDMRLENSNEQEMQGTFRNLKID
ncbi:hypothetical protein HHI36_000054 [Cryptolaemus montrouzieri]|uniref:CRAL-TRIO domain-containing protein n=1 Tax=Cryptolaemus montrouzieri TaxID=559131 RepID=A0ABD2P3G1_9CUCU